MKVKPFGKNLKLEIVRMEKNPIGCEDFNELYLNHKEKTMKQTSLREQFLQFREGRKAEKAEEKPVEISETAKEPVTPEPQPEPEAPKPVRRRRRKILDDDDD